jgi:WXXGXW repeat (2 copies)
MRLIRSLSFAVLATVAAASASLAQIVSIVVAPPALPVYEQPPIPAAGYMWTPGYWAYGDDGYYWVPGTWVEPPTVGLLWTPGYWGWDNGVYAWNAGYWGPHVGYYGGINYGYGYVGSGYAGGVWRGGVFSYNRTVNNFGGVRISNTYNKTVINSTSITRVSFNGGTGGTTVRPTPQQLALAKEQHTPATALQTQHQQTASANRDLHASVNHGSPAIAATSSAGQFTGHGVVGAKAAVATGHEGTHPGGGAALTSPGGAVHTLSHTSPTPGNGPKPSAGQGTANPTANISAHNPPAHTPHVQTAHSPGPSAIHAASAAPRVTRPAPRPAPPHPNKPGQPGQH